jgi:hypothetical protein
MVVKACKPRSLVRLEGHFSYSLHFGYVCFIPCGLFNSAVGNSTMNRAMA